MTRKSDLPDIGRRLAAARARRALSQGTVARLAGIAPSYLSRIENGRIQPTFPTALRVMRALHVELDEIIGPEPLDARKHHSCPVSAAGRCLLDLIRSGTRTGRRRKGGEFYTPREIRLLRNLAAWMQSASPERLRAMEVLLDDLMRGAERTNNNNTRK